jgi:hypothetical protein
VKTVNLEKLLPSDIPPGERVLWFGKPDPKSLWRRAYRADWVIAWFAAVAAWSFYSAQAAGGVQAGLFAALGALGLCVATLAILGALAWLGARSSLYVVTERRLVIKSGIAVPIFINLPFSRITAANVRVFGDATGDVSVTIADGQHVSYIALWPSARPLHFTKPEPTLRCVPQARTVAETLGRALAAAAGQESAAPKDTSEAAAVDVAAATTQLPASA